MLQCKKDSWDHGPSVESDMQAIHHQSHDDKAIFETRNGVSHHAKFLWTRRGGSSAWHKGKGCSLTQNKASYGHNLEAGEG